jgi:hypothetical protein
MRKLPVAREGAIGESVKKPKPFGLGFQECRPRFQKALRKV